MYLQHVGCCLIFTYSTTTVPHPSLSTVLIAIICTPLTTQWQMTKYHHPAKSSRDSELHRTRLPMCRTEVLRMSPNARCLHHLWWVHPATTYEGFSNEMGSASALAILNYVLETFPQAGTQLVRFSIFSSWGRHIWIPSRLCYVNLSTWPSMTTRFSVNIPWDCL